MPSYKVTYFNGKGRAELSRLILTAAGVEFTDERVTNWPTGKEDAPLGQLPYLTVDDVKLPQSLSMARFLAKRFNLAGSDDLEQAKSDAVVDTLNDLQNAYYQKYYMAKPEEKEQVKAKFLAEDAPTHLARLEKIIGMYGSNGFSVGSSLKWSDLAVLDITSLLVNLDSNVLSSYPNVLAVRKTVETNERVATYLKNRPETPF